MKNAIYLSNHLTKYAETRKCAACKVASHHIIIIIIIINEFIISIHIS